MDSKKRIQQNFNFASSTGYEDISKWILWVGVLIAVIAGAIGYLTTIVVGFLVVFGFVIGFFRVKDEMEFMIGGVGFILVISFAKDAYVIPVIGSIIDGLSALISPAVIIVALKKAFKGLKG